jgi:hypothetical protein
MVLPLSGVSGAGVPVVIGALFQAIEQKRAEAPALADPLLEAVS